MKTIRTWMLAGLMLGFVVASPKAGDESVQAPQMHPGDSWVVVVSRQTAQGFHQDRLELTVDHIVGDNMALSSRPAGSQVTPTQRLLGLDWSRSRDVNGRQTQVTHPLAFPLSVGRTWDLEFSENNPNREHSNERFHTVFRVVGWEDVTVPAGTFHALKIEGQGDWHATIAPAVTAASGGRVDAQGVTAVAQSARIVPHEATGRRYSVFWYAPEVKHWVKSLEEVYSSTGVRSEQATEELQSFKLAP